MHKNQMFSRRLFAAALVTALGSSSLSLPASAQTDEVKARQQLILRVPDTHRRSEIATLPGERTQTQISWSVQHKSDFGPVEVVEFAAPGLKFTVGSIGTQMKTVIISIEFFGPYVPMVAAVVNESGDLVIAPEMAKDLDAAKKKEMQELLKEVQEPLKERLAAALRHLRIATNAELESYINSRGF